MLFFLHCFQSEDLSRYTLWELQFTHTRQTAKHPWIQAVVTLRVEHGIVLFIDCTSSKLWQIIQGIIGVPCVISENGHSFQEYQCVTFGKIQSEAVSRALTNAKRSVLNSKYTVHSSHQAAIKQVYTAHDLFMTLNSSS